MKDRSKWKGKIGSIERAADLCQEYGDEKLIYAENLTSHKIDLDAINTAVSCYELAQKLRFEQSRRELNGNS